ncbi:hypothetical protein CHS0354_003341 [Potamilus streckersoni]|uniref:Uncharacterized protein n=1 Tax=Potamilus streckersoni TaxID=2493646 RepID=A0AAE0S5A2_9BIVA|nr:hypothetical protein CHS0354_003341 [Potamilus streckersoni]
MAASTPGPDGIHCKVYKHYPRLTRRIWRLITDKWRRDPDNAYGSIPYKLVIPAIETYSLPEREVQSHARTLPRTSLS